MADENQNGTPTPIDPTNVSVKRKRGRPRKDDTASESVKKRPYRRAEQYVQFGDVSVGQTVTGVLDGKFDAGYMLTVTVGSSGTVLTGVVFEQGRSVPVSAANDIAPNVEMLKRVEVPIPSSRHPSQPMPKRDDAAMHSMESSRLAPDAFNVKHPPDTLLQNAKVLTSHDLVSSNTSHAVLHSDLTLKSPSSLPVHGPDGQTNKNATSAPEFSVSEPMEIKVALTSDKEPVPTVVGTTKNSTHTPNTLPPASEPVKANTVEAPNYKTVETASDKTVETQNDKPVLTKELSAHSTIIPQLAPLKTDMIDTPSDKTMETPNDKPIEAPIDKPVPTKELLAHLTGIPDLPSEKAEIIESPIDETMKTSNNMVVEAPNDKSVLTKGLSVHPTISQLAAIHENERTLDLLGRKSGYSAEPSVGSLGAKPTDNCLSRGLTAEVRPPVEQNTGSTSQGLDSRSQPKIQSQTPELNLQTSLFTPDSERLHGGGTAPSSDLRQTSDITEASNDTEFQLAAGDDK